MEALMIVVIGVLVGVGVFLLLSRVIVRVVLGLSFISYGVNLAILTAPGLSLGSPPIRSLDGPYVDPLPQALILTAIVIGFATTALLLTVAIRAYQVAGHDDAAAFGDNLADDPSNPDGLQADAEHPSPDIPDTEHYEEAPMTNDLIILSAQNELEQRPPQPNTPESNTPEPNGPEQDQPQQRGSGGGQA